MSDENERMLGKYRLITRLGEGAMSHVYKAFQPGPDRYVAVKVLQQHFKEEEDTVTRFKREANAVARLHHPNIVPLFDADVDEDTPYMVMQLIEGVTLKEELDRRRQLHGPEKPLFSVAETIQVLEELANAIDYAHRQRIIHRDLKPSNIMINPEGKLFLMDFGLARIADSFADTFAVVGTPLYMSPEQAMRAQPITNAADIYSLGVITYEMLTGRPPFNERDTYRLLRAHVEDMPPSPLEFVPALGETVADVLLRALSKLPERRYHTAQEFVEALKEATIQAAEKLVAPPEIAALPETAVYLQCVKTGQRFPVQGRSALIGRSAEADIDLSSLVGSHATSRIHANMWRNHKGEYWLKDEHSRNGTIVNGVMLAGGKRVLLGNGSELQFGVNGPVMQFHMPEG
jgi:serine/threonine-protein kinase